MYLGCILQSATTGYILLSHCNNSTGWIIGGPDVNQKASLTLSEADGPGLGTKGNGGDALGQC